MTGLYYLAYGSNLHPVRLTSRVPSACLVGLAQIPGYQLRFHKRHQEDGSGKCNMFATGNPNDYVIGAIYSMQAQEKPLLDRCEGPGYRCDSMAVPVGGRDYPCFVYLAETSHIDDTLVPHCWYRNIVLLGAEHHRFPATYLDAIRQVITAQDPDLQRHATHYHLIDQMKLYSAAHPVS